MGIPYLGKLATQVRQRKTCPLKHLVFQSRSPKTRRRRSFLREKFRSGWLEHFEYSVAISKRILQLRSRKMSVQVTKLSGQWGMSNLFRKVSKISALCLSKTGQKKLTRNIIAAAQPNGVQSIPAKPLTFRNFLCRQDSKMKPLPSKKSENWIFFR